MREAMEAYFEEKGDLVVIHARDSATGVAAEYDYIEARFGARGRDWRFVRQRLMRLDPDRWMDVISIEMADGTELELRFDITEFSGLSGGDVESDDDGEEL